MAKSQLYKVSLAKGFPAESRHSRAGLTLQTNESVEVELTSDQVKEIKDDRFMVLAKVSGEGKNQSGDEDQGGSSTESGSDEGQADDSAEDQGAEDSSAQDSEESSGEDEGAEDGASDGSEEGSDADGASDSQEGEEATDTEGSDDSEEESSVEDQGAGDDGEADEAPSVDDLVRDNSREELNALAVEAGVQNPQELENKPAVAEAIVSKRSEA